MVGPEPGLNAFLQGEFVSAILHFVYRHAERCSTLVQCRFLAGLQEAVGLHGRCCAITGVETYSNIPLWIISFGKGYFESRPVWGLLFFVGGFHVRPRIDIEGRIENHVIVVKHFNTGYLFSLNKSPAPYVWDFPIGQVVTPVGNLLVDPESFEYIVPGIIYVKLKMI